MHPSIFLTLSLSLLVATYPVPPRTRNPTAFDTHLQTPASDEPVLDILIILDALIPRSTTPLDTPSSEPPPTPNEPPVQGLPFTVSTTPINTTNKHSPPFTVSTIPIPRNTTTSSNLSPRQTTTITEDPTLTIANITFGSVNLINVPHLPGEAFLEGDSDSGGEDGGSGDANSVANGYPANSVGVGSSSFNDEGSTSGGSACTLFVCSSETSAQNENGTSSETSGSGLINIDNDAPLGGGE
ncbi:hypothetical protein MMC10_007207 [Thelotrema lepadinum]|nr:hypothetical protein [Thelotrema lepadinum]